ncbi:MULTISPECIES: MerR family transcriptional regulator [unclassified Microbulbifer]|uniref:MerR family transcriptional regulator n=1 Tax=unclassified Microbulbifer TaxID=2619833 RepID=UPI0027E3F93C|nr:MULTISPECIES: MerR family transcriptional regulator [unclassified Microbulbifer]
MNVKEFARRAGISPHTVRYYEKIGLLRDIRRFPNGHRDFSEKNISWISFVQRLKETGMPLKQIHRYANLREQGESTLEERQTLLEQHAATLEKNLAEQQRHLDKLREKIALYQSAISGHKTPLT